VVLGLDKRFLGEKVEEFLQHQQNKDVAEAKGNQSPGNCLAARGRPGVWSG
jgi:hypothetical protein